MKYIRTKDKIVKHPHPNAEVFTFRYEIVKQADTIEELCDYVIRVPSGSVDDRPFVLKTIIHKGFLDGNNYDEIREELKQQYEMQKNGDKATIYLAIPIDKGLIYVAKMNDKGELDLL